MASNITKPMNDLDMLYDYEKDARLAAVGYLGMVAEAHDEQLREKFATLSAASQKTHEQFAAMIAKKGGNIF